VTARRQRIPTFEPCFNDRVTAFWHFGQLADEHPDNLQGNGTPTASGVAHYRELASRLRELAQRCHRVAVTKPLAAMPAGCARPVLARARHRIAGAVPCEIQGAQWLRRSVANITNGYTGTLRVFPGSKRLFYCGSSATFKKKVTLRDRCDSLPLPKRGPNLPGIGESEIRGQLACTFRWGRAYAPAQGCGRVD
jgi:hypothetical protein